MRHYVRLILLSKLVFGTVYCQFAGEVFLRVFHRQPMLPRHVCAMPYGIRGNEPNESYWHSSAEYRIHIRTNSKGIRSDREIPYEKLAGVKRIVLLGDSFGIGYEVNLEDTFTSRMVYYLKERYGIDAELVNLSTSGHGNAEELIVLEHEGVKYEPDLVLLAWHESDYDDNVRSGLYRLEAGTLTRAAATYLPGVKIQQFLYRSRTYRFLADNSNLYNLVRDSAGRTVRRILAKVRAKKPLPAGAGAAPPPSKEDLTMALLKEIQRVSQAHGAAFLILDIPNPLSPAGFQSVFPASGKEEAGAFDIVSPIRNLETAKEQKVFWARSQGHFTPLGCDLVGQALAQHIAEKGLLKP
jgi:hypothetical protein